MKQILNLSLTLAFGILASTSVHAFDIKYFPNSKTKPNVAHLAVEKGCKYDIVYNEYFKEYSVSYICNGFTGVGNVGPNINHIQPNMAPTQSSISIPVTVNNYTNTNYSNNSNYSYSNTTNSGYSWVLPSWSMPTWNYNWSLPAFTTLWSWDYLYPNYVTDYHYKPTYTYEPAYYYEPVYSTGSYINDNSVYSSNSYIDSNLIYNTGSYIENNIIETVGSYID